MFDANRIALWSALSVLMTPNAMAMDLSCADESGLRSKNANRKAEITFATPFGGAHNKYDLYWINYEGDRELYNTIYVGQSVVQPTFMGHPWVVTVTGADGGEECYGIYLPTTEPRMVELK